MAKSKVLQFPTNQSPKGGTQVTSTQDTSLTDARPPVMSPQELVQTISVLDAKDIDQAAKLAAYNWRNLPWVRWTPEKALNEHYWGLFPIDYDGSNDLVRESNWLALKDTMVNYGEWQAKFLRFSHPSTTCVHVLAIQVGFGTLASLSPAFRLFHKCVDALQKNIPIDEEIYRNIWEDEIKEQIRLLGQPLVRVGEVAEDSSGYGHSYAIGWTTKVLRYIINRSPELLSAEVGKLPVLKVDDVRAAMNTMNLLRPEYHRQETIGVGP